MNSVHSRRGLLSLGLAAAGLAVAGCGTGDATKAAGGAAWTYTDSRGKRITVNHRPQRIVAYSSIIGALTDYGIHFTGVYGPHSPVNGGRNPQIGSANLQGVGSVGEQYGDFSVEKLLALKPDIVLEASFVKGQPFYVPKDILPKIEQAVPVALVDSSQTMSVPDHLSAFADLARSLGGTPVPAAAKAQFDQVSNSIRATVKTKPKLRVVAISGKPDQVYITHPKGMANLQYLADLGVHMVDGPYLQQAEVFSRISWEQLSSFPADVVLYDERPQSLTKDQLLAQPTLHDLPAARAGQLVPWNPEVPFSYQQFARNLQPIAQALSAAQITA